ncbi:MAG TPA: DUF4118 domain-containing protein, partial [Acidobacteriota bacterium]|nr:DUF4118 domain-containing protein [Acidobacteriota bacterium]
YIAAIAGIVLVTIVLEPIRQHINSTTVALALLLVVLFVATVWGMRQAVLASVVGMLSFNFFFLPPVRTFTIADPDNWVALGAFLVTAVTAGHLSASVRQRAEEAETRRLEIEHLYRELQAAFERESHLEAIRQSEQLKSALLDAVTHDLRTPLTSIKVSVTTLLDETEPGAEFALDREGQHELLQIIDEETDRLNRFIEGLVGLARIEAGKFSLRRTWNAVDEVIAAALHRAESQTRQHRIILELAEELPSVRVDAHALAEVIYTLVENAAKYSPPDTTIAISAKTLPGEFVQISIEDQGIGVPAEEHEKVFEKFYRVASTHGNEPGHPTSLGLGLSIAQGIVEAHGGK